MFVSLWELKWLKQLIQIFIPNDSRLYSDPDKDTVSSLFLTIKTVSAHVSGDKLETVDFQIMPTFLVLFHETFQNVPQGHAPCSTSITVDFAKGLSKLHFPYSQCVGTCLYTGKKKKECQGSSGRT